MLMKRGGSQLLVMVGYMADPCICLVNSLMIPIGIIIVSKQQKEYLAFRNRSFLHCRQDHLS
jgi:hypothetical protein